MHTGTEGVLPEGESDYSKLLEDWRIYYERKRLETEGSPTSSTASSKDPDCWPRAKSRGGRVLPRRSRTSKVP
jgi:hypothetical protein